MFDTTRDQMKNWRWDIPHPFGDQVDHSNPVTTRSGKVNHIRECFSWYGSDDLKALIEPTSCRRYKPGDYLPVTSLNWDEIVEE